MLRTGLIIVAVMAALEGICFGQGFLDSTLGPGGLGLWGRGRATSQQYNNPQMWAGAQGPSQKPYQNPAIYGQQQIAYPPAANRANPQSYPGKGAGYPQQVFLNSIFGPSGLGLWGGGEAASQQNNDPQMWGGAQGPSQQPYQNPATYGQQQIAYPPAASQANPQSYPGKGAGYPQQQYSGQQQGVYGFPQSHPPAPIGDKPQQYSATHASSAPQQSQGPVQYVASPAQAGSGPAVNATTEQPLRLPRPYVPGQARVIAGNPNPAAMRMTTAPNGTEVQYCPQRDKSRGPQGSIKRPSQQLKPKRAGAKAQSKKRTQGREAANKWSTTHPW